MASASRPILSRAIAAAASRRYKHSSPPLFSATNAPPTSTTSPLLLRSIASPISPPSWRIRSWSLATAAQIPIKVGDRLPDETLSHIDRAGNVQTVSISALAAGKKIVLFAVPGAFTPTCSQKHLPEFVAKADDLKAKGVDLIACVAVNDAFVLKAWADSLGIDGEKLIVLSDGNRRFTDAMGVACDLSDKPVGLGVRSRRYSLLAEDGVVKLLNLEEGGAFTISGAEEMLKGL